MQVRYQLRCVEVIANCLRILSLVALTQSNLGRESCSCSLRLVGGDGRSKLLSLWIYRAVDFDFRNEKGPLLVGQEGKNGWLVGCLV